MGEYTWIYVLGTVLKKMMDGLILAMGDPNEEDTNCRRNRRNRDCNLCGDYD